MKKIQVLSEELLIQICKKSLENAKELLSDAEILKTNNRPARSYALFQLAMEETGKAIFCYLIIFHERYHDSNTVKEFNTVFGSHKHKTEKSGAINIIIAQVLFKGNFEGAMSYLEESINEKNRLQEIDDLKNHSLYTSIVDGVVKNPSEVITDKLLKGIELNARSRFGAINAFVTVGIDHLPALRDYQRENPIHEMNIEAEVNNFWKEIMS